MIISANLFKMEVFGAQIDATVRIGLCGDGIITSGEQCDGANLGGATCVSRGFSSGTLNCGPSCEFNTSSCIAVSSSFVGGSGGGGGGILNGSSKIMLKGMAYPNSNVVIFKDGTTVATPIADSNGNFQAEIEIQGGIYSFSIYTTDSENRKSITTSFTTRIFAGQETVLSDIVIPPSVSADKSQVKFGNEIKFFGYSYPESQINIIINSKTTLIEKTESDSEGFWTYFLNSSLLEKDNHTIKTQTILPNGTISPFSESLVFKVGDSDTQFQRLQDYSLSAGPLVCGRNGDIDNSGKVNLIDFSIMLFFWNQRNLANPCADINKDGAVDLSDFSIMMFWWNG